MKKEIDIFGNKELQDEAIRELYTGSDIDNVLLDKPFFKCIFYDVLDSHNELVPVGLIVSCSGEKEDILEMVEDDMVTRLFENDYTKEPEASKIYGMVDELLCRMSERFSNIGRTLFIKDMSMKEDCTRAGERIFFGIRECLKEGSCSTAICITDINNNVMDLLEGMKQKNVELGVELMGEIGDLRVWRIEEKEILYF